MEILAIVDKKHKAYKEHLNYSQAILDMKDIIILVDGGEKEFVYVRRTKKCIAI